MRKKISEYKKFLKKIIYCPSCHKNKISYKVKYCLCTHCGEKYPIIFDIPILMSNKKCKNLKLNYYKKNYQKKILNSQDFNLNKYGIIKHVEKILMGTSGILYENIKTLKEYPFAKIPFSQLKKNKNRFLLDVGCGWGRWTISAAQKYYISIGIDKSIKSLIAAKKICDSLNIKNCFFICCDAKEIPLKNNFFDAIFSFSFLQHFSENNLKTILKNIYDKLKNGGTFKTQMVNKYSLRGLYNSFKIKYFPNKMIKTGKMDKRKDEDSFTVRYFSIIKIRKIFKEFFFIKEINNYSFFTQAQMTDFKIFDLKFKGFMIIANFFNLISNYFFFLKYLSDNIMITLTKKIIK